MYAPTYPASSSSPYTSPTAVPSDPYRASPIPVASRQPYSSAFSPPPQHPNGFQAMPSGQSQRYQQQFSPQTYARGPGGGSGSGGNRYASPAPAQFPNGYAQQPPLPHPPHHAPPPQRHKGTLAPGQMVHVGDHTVRIERYLSEGGYAHVYLTTSEKPIYPPIKGEKKGRWGEKGYSEHCLKRIAFEDDAVWVDVKKEIEVMKSLPPNPHLTQYLGSAHSRLPTGGHEVFILMEFCAGGGIIDLLNKRLRDRLKEIEILNIFTDVCEAVAAMHALSQPLLHRDLKIENVLSQPIQAPATPQRPTPLVFKLCDFGSTTFPADKPPSSKLEADALAMDLNRHTTLQYRSPEMVEPMLGLPVGLPSDVWALGCLLYKLCYYTTPFEEHGPLAIVNAKYTFPPVPAYSPRLQHMIASMLVEQPIRRPTVFEVLKIAHDMSGTKPEINYPTPSRSLSRPAQKNQAIPSQSANLLDFTSSSSPIDKTPSLQPTLASTVQPQRRGRPTREPSQKQITPAFSSAASSQSPPSATEQATARPAPRLQVTGDKPSPAPLATLDAFGMPTASSASQSTTRGFGDSFAAPAPVSAPKATHSVGPSRFGANLPRPASGFGDSFGGARSAVAASSSPKKSPLLPINRVPSTSGIPAKSSATSPSAKKSDPSSSIPNGELSFEARFPSIETLSGDVVSPASETSKPESLISPTSMPPAERPPFQAKLSMMGNMTGGDLNSPTQTTSRLAPTGPLQPRSTNVTGTAFRGGQGGVTSPASTQQHDYFSELKPDERPAASPSASSTSASTAKSPMPLDLLGNETQSGLQVPLIKPGRSISPSASSVSSSAPSSAIPPAQRPQQSATGHSRPLLPHIDSAKPSLNIMSDQWSPLESLKRSESSSQAQNPDEDSSDDEVGPENASARAGRPFSPQKPTQGEDASSSRTWRQSTIPAKSATIGGPSSARSPPLGGERSRPQSMFAMPSSGSIKSFSQQQQTTEEPSGLPRPSSRPSHGRKGSITDIVSRYESMKPPSHAGKRGSVDNNAPTEAPTTINGLTKKPSVATKPQALRKPTLENKPTTTSSAQSPTMSTSPIESVKPKLDAKPTVMAPKPVRYGETPRPEGYSRSSSGRAFPITKPKSDRPSDPPAPAAFSAEKQQSQDGSAPPSPEKQQSVNSLIARWNQGQTANASANSAKPRGGFI